MRWLLILGFWLAISTTVTAASRQRLDPHDGAVLPIAAAKELLHQCSRESPHEVTGSWSPTVGQIRQLESQLPGSIETLAFQRGHDYAQPPEFMRQYAGFIISGRKVIYVNAFPKGMIEEEARALPGRPEFDWRHEAMRVCDGGHRFFGVEYDPATKIFSRFSFNGAI